MKNGFEYYYLFGLDIPLYEFGLGTIVQPKLLDYIKNDIDLEKIYIPFLTVSHVRHQLQEKEEQLEIFNQLGGLGYLLFISRFGDGEYIKNLVKMIKFLYNTEDVSIDKELSIVVDKKTIIKSSNFDILCDIVLEMFMISKPVFQDKKPKYKNKKLQETWEKLQMYRAKEAKKKEIKISDIINIMSHINGDISYDRVMNLTMYQLKNSYSTLMNQGTYDELIKYKTSGQFKFEKEISHWTTDSKVNKSAYSFDE